MNVFDFDNTIYDGETLIDFALHYVKTDPKIWKYVPKLLVICFKDAFHLFTVEEAIEAYASFLEGYFIHIKTLDEDVVKFWDKNEKKINLYLQFFLNFLENLHNQQQVTVLKAKLNNCYITLLLF